MSRSFFTSVFLLAAILFASCGDYGKRDIRYDGKYPRIATISYSEDGENYKIPAVAGHCVVFFSDSVSHSKAKEIIKAGGGRIIEQMPAFNYYLVKVQKGEEGGFVTYMNELSNVEYAYFNTPDQLLSEVYIMDDFEDVVPSMLTTHGNGVRKTFSKYSNSDDIHSRYMVFLNDNDTMWWKHTTASNIILSELLDVAKTVTNEDLTLVNMSFGPSLPGKKNDYDKYNDIDTTNQKLYRRLYANKLKELAVSFDKMRAKGISNFIVTRSSGNQAMHDMQDILEMLDEKTINSLKDNLVLVCAHDKKRQDLYSNFPNVKHPLMTTVDVTDEPWNGTSFSAPKLMAYLDKVHGRYENLSAGQLLQAVRNATPDNPQEPMAYEMLDREAKRLSERVGNSKKYTFRLNMTKDGNGEWDLSDGRRDEFVRYEVHNTYGEDYLNGVVKAVYLENNTGKNLNIYLNVISSDREIRPMHYTLPVGGREGFFAYQMGTMEILSVNILEVQLSTW